MKYLVLGSEGQIGKHLVVFLRNKGHFVYEYDIRRNSNEDLRLFEPYRDSKIRQLEADVREVDFVFFLAWDVGGSKYLSETEFTFDFIHNNTAIMNSTFAVLKKYNKPFVFTSSQMASMEFSPYGNTKIIGERYTHALNGICVRLWNVYGYERIDERSHVITDFIEMGIRDKVIKMRTDGGESRQFLYVEDCCEALYVLSEQYGSLPKNQNFHVSSYVWTPIERVAEIISLFLGCQYIKGDKKDNVQMDIQKDPDKNMLQYWKPKISIEEGIECVIKKMKSSQNL